MNTYRYDEERRKQWVRDKITRAKTVRQICQEAAISRATLYNWLDEFAGLEEAVPGEEVKDTSSRGKASRPELLRKTSPEAGERYRMLVSAISGIDTNLALSKKLVAVLVKRFTLSVAQACAVVGIDESVYGYKPRKPEAEDYVVYEALVSLIREDRTRDFETCYDLLLKQYPDWTRKQIKRVYRDGMVYLERKRANNRWEKAGRAAEQAQREAPPASAPAAGRIQRPGTTWNLALLEYRSEIDGIVQPWWMLCILEEESSLHLNAHAGLGSVTTDEIISFLDRAAAENGTPRKLKIPGKPALAVRELTRWVWEHKMALHTFSLEKPENAEAIARTEQMILESLGPDVIGTSEQLERAAEGWIAKAELLQDA